MGHDFLGRLGRDPNGGGTAAGAGTPAVVPRPVRADRPTRSIAMAHPSRPGS